MLRTGDIVVVKKMFINFGASTPAFIQPGTVLLVTALQINEERLLGANFLMPNGFIARYEGAFLRDHIDPARVE